MARGGQSAVNHLYVGRAEMSEDGFHSVLVYWAENRALVLREPGRGRNRQADSEANFDVADSRRRYWRPGKDVVPATEFVMASAMW